MENNKIMSNNVADDEEIMELESTEEIVEAKSNNLITTAAIIGLIAIAGGLTYK